MEISAIIIEFAPAITAVIGIIVAVVSGIKKVKNNNAEVIALVEKKNEEQLAEIKQTNKELLEAQQELIKQNLALQEENQELKDLTRKTLNRLNHIKEK